jgi:hypothetical protein
MNTRKMLKNNENQGRGYGKGHVKSQYSYDFKNKCVHKKDRTAAYINRKMKIQEKKTSEKSNLYEKRVLLPSLPNDLDLSFLCYLYFDEFLE